MSWRFRRQMFYFGIFTAVVVGILALIIIPRLVKSPTCFDNKKNGDETGIDCGGNCALYCPFTVDHPVTLWTRVFPINNELYNVISYVENQNSLAGARSAGYTFRIYDEEGKAIIERRGNTFIPPNGRFAVFEAQVSVGQRIPKSAIFFFDNDIRYEKVSDSINRMPLRTERITRDSSGLVERITLDLINQTLYPVPESEYIAIVYDEAGDPIAASKTRASVDANSRTELFYSWPYLFSRVPQRVEIVKRLNPFVIFYDGF